MDLIAIAPSGATWLPVVRQHLEQAARQAGIDPATVHPSAEARALVAASESGPAAATAEEVSRQQRSQTIQGMVDRLAARLRDNPDDLEGWRRLARAYQVLGEADKARDAQARVHALERR
jgi:cytochrome c-type biogenesis protein CcmH